MDAPDPTLWLPLCFVAGCAAIHLTQRWAAQVTVVLFGTFVAVTMLLVLALSNQSSAWQPAIRGSVAVAGISSVN